jgi:AbrB family looped-hinge helix DNA binding protein
MPIVRVSRRYQIVIPKELRQKLKLRAGQKLHIYELEGSIRVSPLRPSTELRGIAKGMKWKDDDRDHTERF